MENKNKPAFPSETATGLIQDGTGLTKREHFAGLFMAARYHAYVSTSTYERTPEQLASDSVNMADALLKRLDHE